MIRTNILKIEVQYRNPTFLDNINNNQIKIFIVWKLQKNNQYETVMKKEKQCIENNFY